MNGRIYDPLLGRFLSADVFVQDAHSLQAYNRYSYVRNNPLTRIDPSGFADTLTETPEQKKKREDHDAAVAMSYRSDARLGFGSPLALFAGIAASNGADTATTSRTVQATGVANKPLDPDKRIRTGKGATSRDSWSTDIPFDDTSSNATTDPNSASRPGSFANPINGWILERVPNEFGGLDVISSAVNINTGQVVYFGVPNYGMPDQTINVASLIVAPPILKTVFGWLGSKLFGRAAETVPAVKPGSFSIVDWTGYPESIPKPTGPFRLLEGAEYDAARAQADAANRAMHAADKSLGGWQLHEIQPVKFDGSPVDIANKMPLPAGAHSEVTTWWRSLQRYLENPNPP